MKSGYFRFSWTFLFFGWFVPIFRGELLVELLHLAMTVVAFGIWQVIIAFLYNKQYMTRMLEKGMRGIVKIPSRKVPSFDAVRTMLKLAHHFLSTLKKVDNVQNSGTEFNTFNPFVVGSTPAGPTKIQVKSPCSKVQGDFF